MVSNTKDLNIDDIKKDVEALKDSLAAQTKQLKNLAENQLNKMKEKGKSVASDVEDNAYRLGERARESLEGVSEKFKVGASYIEDQTKSHPWLVVGAAFLIGMFIEKLGSNKNN
jgi:ElaB/YqjD/DUF883 family membrane-anchored ribosome-binding protein